MEDISVVNKTDINNNEKVRINFKSDNLFHKKPDTNPVIANLIAEGDETFFDYLYWHGLANEPNLLELSSSNHYYYEFEELKGVRTLINKKELNLIKQLNVFLGTLYNVLPPKANFIGCFSDCKTQKGITLSSRIYKKFINFLDSRIDIEFDKADISRLLETAGFKVMDMTEINGLTYFLSQS